MALTRWAQSYMRLRRIIETAKRPEKIRIVSGLVRSIHNELVDLNLECRECHHVIFCTKGQCFIVRENKRKEGAND